MTRSLGLMQGVAAAAAAAGLMLLLRPGLVRRTLRLNDGGQADYALRIIGMMLTALALFLGGFSTMFHWASAS